MGGLAASVLGAIMLFDSPEPALRASLAVILPIAIEADCLTCHGDPASFTPDLQEQLASRYPKDRAVGYHVGDLRGALWAEISVADAKPSPTE